MRGKPSGSGGAGVWCRWSAQGRKAWRQRDRNNDQAASGTPTSLMPPAVPRHSPATDPNALRRSSAQGRRRRRETARAMTADRQGGNLLLKLMACWATAQAATTTGGRPPTLRPPSLALGHMPAVPLPADRPHRRAATPPAGRDACASARSNSSSDTTAWSSPKSSRSPTPAPTSAGAWGPPPLPAAAGCHEGRVPTQPKPPPHIALSTTTARRHVASGRPSSIQKVSAEALWATLLG